MENCATKIDLSKMSDKMSEYATAAHLKALSDDIGNMIKLEDFNILSRDIDRFKRDMGRLCTKEELMTRLNVFNSDVNTKLHDRPTISYFKKVLSAYDQKIE